MPARVLIDRRQGLEIGERDQLNQLSIESRNDCDLLWLTDSRRRRFSCRWSLKLPCVVFCSCDQVLWIRFDHCFPLCVRPSVSVCVWQCELLVFNHQLVPCYDCLWWSSARRRMYKVQTIFVPYASSPSISISLCTSICLSASSQSSYTVSPLLFRLTFFFFLSGCVTFQLDRVGRVHVPPPWINIRSGNFWRSAKRCGCVAP